MFVFEFGSLLRSCLAPSHFLRSEQHIFPLK
jgi:hypothetical protein